MANDSLDTVREGRGSYSSKATAMIRSDADGQTRLLRAPKFLKPSHAY